MPTLHWIGKDKVVNHHHEVPFRVLERDAAKSFPAQEGSPANSSDNRIIHGDNLEALKSLLPEFEGRVKCIYIDPPYNTGNEGWVYNDNVNDPKLKKWLGEVVGKEGEDLSRHDKWLCMMYPRLKLLHRLLAEDGSIWISIDDNESAYLKLILDEVFGVTNFRSSIAWQRKYSVSNNAKGIAPIKDTILCYSKTNSFINGLLPRSAASSDRYQNPDNDLRGPWKPVDYWNQASPKERPNLCYDIINPFTKITISPSKKAWKYSKETHLEHLQDNRLWWGKNKDNSVPSLKLFLSEVRDGMIPNDFWTHDDFGHTDEAKKEIEKIFNKSAFDTPKPVRLIERILQIAALPNDIILDSFAGSGTTAHAVLKLNAEDGGNRRFILIETMDYADNITAERVRRVIKGYGEDKKAVPGTGGGFDYYEMGPPIFKEPDLLNEEVGVEVIRSYVAHSEGIPKEQRCGQDNPVCTYLLGFNEDIAWVFYYEKDRMTTLDLDFLRTLKFDSPRPASALIYADRCILPKEFLAQHRLIFKKIPRDIARF